MVPFSEAVPLLPMTGIMRSAVNYEHVLARYEAQVYLRLPSLSQRPQ